MGYGLSNFPESFDNFKTLRSLPPSRIQDAQRLQYLKSLEAPTNEELLELNQLTVTLEDYIISEQRWNHMGDALTATQKEFTENIEPFMNAKKNEINTTTNSAISNIQSTTDSALITIEQKKANIIDYMDSTTAGQIRNDIGIMGELTTTDKSNLVNAINEINNKEVDLSPIQNEILLLSEQVSNIKGYVLKGSASFNSTTGTVIPHALGHTEYVVMITPSQNPNGYLGEIWVEYAENNFIVKCSGTSNATFKYVVLD